MTNLNLKEIREMNDKRLPGYWKSAIAQLCDTLELEQQKRAESDLKDLRQLQDAYDQLWREHGVLLAATRDWAKAIAGPDGVAAAEQALLTALRECRP